MGAPDPMKVRARIATLGHNDIEASSVGMSASMARKLWVRCCVARSIRGRQKVILSWKDT